MYITATIRVFPILVLATRIPTFHACYSGTAYPPIYRNGKTSYGSNHRNAKSFDGGFPYQNILKTTFSSKKKDNSLGLFDTIHSKFVALGQGYHGAPVYHFQYHMEDARWIHIQPMALGKVVVSNTCPQFFHDKDRCPEQSKQINVAHSTKASRSWKADEGFSRKKNFGLDFNAGVPFLKIDMTGDKSWGITKSESHNLGQTETKLKSWTIFDKCVAGAGQIATCKFCAINIQIEVPFTIWRTDGEEIHGHFNGNDYIYGGLAISYRNLWPSNKSYVPVDYIFC